MRQNAELQPWVDLADDLVSFEQFMHEYNLVPMRIGEHRKAKFLDVGMATAIRMRTIAANRWTWYSWKKDGMQGEVRAKLHTYHRWLAEGFFYGCEDTEAGQEMLRRIESIERKFKQLTMA